MKDQAIKTLKSISNLKEANEKQKLNKHKKANPCSQLAINQLLNRSITLLELWKLQMKPLESSLREQQFSSYLPCLACCVFLQNRITPVTLKSYDTRLDCHLPLLDTKPQADSHTWAYTCEHTQSRTIQRLSLNKPVRWETTESEENKTDLRI